MPYPTLPYIPVAADRKVELEQDAEEKGATIASLEGEWSAVLSTMQCSVLSADICRVTSGMLQLH